MLLLHCTLLQPAAGHWSPLHIRMYPCTIAFSLQPVSLHYIALNVLLAFLIGPLCE